MVTSWPRRFEDIEGWVAKFTPALRPYLRYLGAQYVTVTGDPVDVRTAAQQFELAAAELARMRQKLNEDLQIVMTWEGYAQDAYVRRHATLVRDLEAAEKRSRRTAELLFAHVPVLEWSQQTMQKIIIAFVRAAEQARVSASKVPYTFGNGPVVAYQRALQSLFSQAKGSADAVVLSFRQSTQRLADALAAIDPTWWQEAQQAITDFFTTDVPQAWDDVLHYLGGFSIDRIAADGIKWLEDQTGRTATAGYYYGFTLTPRGVYIPLAAGAVALGLLGAGAVAAPVAAVAGAVFAFEKYVGRTGWVPALNVVASTDADWNVANVAVRVMPKRLDEGASIFVGAVAGMEKSDGVPRLVQAGALYMGYKAFPHDYTSMLPKEMVDQVTLPGWVSVAGPVGVVKNGYSFYGVAAESNLTWAGHHSSGPRLINLPRGIGQDAAFGLWFNVKPIRQYLGWDAPATPAIPAP